MAEYQDKLYHVKKHHMAQGSSGGPRSQWKAMDLHIGQHQQQQHFGGGPTSNSGRYAATMMSNNMTPASAGAGGGGKWKLDDKGGISARNLLIRRKLMERKRFDSADYALKNSKSDKSQDAVVDVILTSGINTTATDNSAATTDTINSTDGDAPMPSPFSPAQVGVSVFFNALKDPVNNTIQKTSDSNQDTTKERQQSHNQQQQQQAQPVRTGASRYDNIGSGGNSPAKAAVVTNVPQGALSARNILLQKRLREKKQFDSADYQLAQHRRSSISATSSQSSTDYNSSPDRDDQDEMSSASATPMDTDEEGELANSSNENMDADKTEASMNSPSSASIMDGKRDQRFAQLSPSTRGGKYGALSGANELLRRKLAEKKRFDSADYHMKAGPDVKRSAMSNQKQPLFVQAPTLYETDGEQVAPQTEVMAPPAPQTLNMRGSVASSTSTGAGNPTGSGGSKYGKLSAAHVLIRRKLKERKRFDSADYVMEAQQQQHQHQQSDNNNPCDHGSVGALQDGRTITKTNMQQQQSTPANRPTTPTMDDSNASISHQVKHIKLSEERGKWATPATATTSRALPKKNFGNLGQDNRLAARNIMIQRKLTERKRFDSADYFKEAASRG